MDVIFDLKLQFNNSELKNLYFENIQNVYDIIYLYISAVGKKFLKSFLTSRQIKKKIENLFFF